MVNGKENGTKMSRNFRRSSAAGVVILLAAWLGSLWLVSPANAQAGPAWKELDTKDCHILKLSEYRPGKAFCATRNAQNNYRAQINLLDLTTGQVQFLPFLSDSALLTLLYEDPASGYLLVLNAAGDLDRVDASLTREGVSTVLRGPSDATTASIVRSGGEGSGVLFVRFTDNSLWYSSRDNGQTWQRAFASDDPFAPSSIYDIQFSPANPNVAYGLSRTIVEAISGGGYQYYNYLYKSTDGGRTFARLYRTPYIAYEYSTSPLFYSLSLPTSPATDDRLIYLSRYLYQTNSGYYSYYRSLDGGVTFQETNLVSGGRGNAGGELYFAPDGAVIQAGQMSCAADNSCYGTVPARRSLNNAQTFAPLGYPASGYFLSRFVLPRQAAHVYYALAQQPGHAQADPKQPLPPYLIRSTDGGNSWIALPNGGGPTLKNPYDLQFYVTDYSPIMLIATTNGGDKTYVMADLEADRSQTAPTGPYPGQDYYAQTGHNLGMFRGYWTKNGGLAQFGFPRSEVFREVNPSDGHIYPVQYFERNRFEYHAEYKGTTYEVLLGLLGNQLTEARRTSGDGAFNRFADAHYPGSSYFFQTGHNLRNSFKTYWEQHGGLAIYGYPISEEFYEQNPDDGQTYVVQYFERNRFEFHPEYRGTPYEVLLGLLGNTLLKQKGWL